MQDALIALMDGTTGHVVFESGHHGTFWLELDALWISPRAIAPFTLELARRLPAPAFDAVCGPMTGGAFVALGIATELGLPFCYTERHVRAGPDGVSDVTYLLPDAFRATVAGRRIAVVDDVVNAGSATRGTVQALSNAGARTTVIGALLVLGEAASTFAAESGIELVAVATRPAELWRADACPLCARGIPIDHGAT